MSRSQQILDNLRKVYEPYAEIAGSEMAEIESMQARLEKLDDPVWKAFRENPITQDMFKHCARAYRGIKLSLANDDGALTQDERGKMQVGARWAMWFMQALGGDPDRVRAETEAEIERFAIGAGMET